MACLSTRPELSCWSGCFLGRVQDGRTRSTLLFPSWAWFNMLSVWHREGPGCCYVPLCAWGESGKRSMGRSIASLTAMHKGYHNLLTPMKKKCWCLYWANGYLPLTIPSSYDSTDTHYGMEGELRHFSENNANVSGLAPKVTFERSVGRILINCFGALSIALCPSADHPVPW